MVLPTFGWEGECSYRGRRDWAIALARAGATTLRFDFPGTEDSVGSALGPDRLQAWIDSTSDAARWLRRQSGCDRLVLIGIGLGGIVGYKAVADGAPIDDLILWAVRASGRAYIRGQQAFAAVATGGKPDPQDAERSDGLSGLAGHRISAATVAAISSLDLTAMALPPAEGRRVLLIGRDAIGIDQRLRDHFEQSGVELSMQDADDYRRFVMVPDMQLTPTTTIERSIDWWTSHSWAPATDGARSPSSAAASRSAIGDDPETVVADAVSEVEFDFGGVRIRERLLEVESETGRLFAVLAEPVDGPQPRLCLATVNSAWLRRTGPSRLMVEMGRRAAAAGLAAVRLDLPGLGDSEGSAAKVYERQDDDNERAIAALRALYDKLEESGVAERFVSLGLCLGGYVAGATAVADSRSVGVIGLNAQLAWVERQRQWQRRWARDLGALESPVGDRVDGRLPSPRPSVRGLSGRLRKRVEQKLGPRLGRSSLFLQLYWFTYNRAVCRLLQSLGASGLKVLLVCATDESLTRDVASAGPKSKELARWPNLVLRQIPTDSHLFHPLWSQDAVFEIVASYLDETRHAMRQLCAEEEPTGRAGLHKAIGSARQEEEQGVS